jgi:hypothetical protein
VGADSGPRTEHGNGRPFRLIPLSSLRILVVMYLLYSFQLVEPCSTQSRLSNFLVHKRLLDS